MSFHPDPFSEQVATAVSRIRPAVVHVRMRYPREDGITVGSGVLIDGYHVVTVVRGQGTPRDVMVQTADGQKYGASVVGADPLYFLLLLRLDRRVSVELAGFGRADRLAPGQLAIGVGSPFGVEHNVTLGVITGADRTVYRPERLPVDGLIITDAAIHPGNNGGALAWLNGEFIGLCGIPWTETLGLAVQVDVIGRIAHQLIEYGYATHPWLGFSGDPEFIDPQLVQLFKLPVDRGLAVSVVAPGGPGERAGVRELDLVVRVEDRPVNGGVGMIRKVLAAHRPGETVPVTVLRGAELVELKLPVEEMPRLKPLNQ